MLLNEQAIESNVRFVNQDLIEVSPVISRAKAMKRAEQLRRLRRVMIMMWCSIFTIQCVTMTNVCDGQYWYDTLVRLSRLDELQLATDIQKYRFVYRMTPEDKLRLNLPAQNMKAFQPISKKLADEMSVKSPAYPIFVGDGLTPYNYGGLLNKL